MVPRQMAYEWVRSECNRQIFWAARDEAASGHEESQCGGATPAQTGGVVVPENFLAMTGVAYEPPVRHVPAVYHERGAWLWETRCGASVVRRGFRWASTRVVGWRGGSIARVVEDMGEG